MAQGNDRRPSLEQPIPLLNLRAAVRAARAAAVPPWRFWLRANQAKKVKTENQVHAKGKADACADEEGFGVVH